MSAAEFMLEGLHAHKRIGRSEERVFTAGEKQPKRAEKPFEREDERPYPADEDSSTEGYRLRSRQLVTCASPTD